MLKTLIVLSLLCFAFAEEIGVVTKDENGGFRAWAVNSLGTSLSFFGFSFERENDDKWDFSANVDAACIKLTVEPDVAAYFGAATASFDGSWSPNGGIGKVTGASAELVVKLENVCLYEDHDGNPGFQHTLGNDLVCPSSDGTKDCLVADSCLSISDFSWSNLVYKEKPCGTVAQGYNESCKVYTITSEASFYCLKNFQSYKVMNITYFVANQKVTVDGRTVGPNEGKTTWSYMYPYDCANTNVDPDNVHVCSLVGTGGKAGTIEATTVASDQGSVWKGEGASTFFAWSPDAVISGQTTTTYTNTITGQSIIDYKDGNNVITNILIAIWKIPVVTWKAFGWTTNFIIFSWAENRPATVIYDPSFGSSSSALGLAPGLMLPLFICIANYLYRLF